MRLFIFVGTAVCMMASALATEGMDPACHNMACAQEEVCRVMETCDPPNSDTCTHQAVCLSSNDSRYLSGGCWTGEPLLVAQDGGGYDLRACWTENNCRDGFYCSAELQDVSSRCCRAAPAFLPASASKNGTCPQPYNSTDRIFCTDECRSDADCRHDYKCCRQSIGCERMGCTPPDPCSLKTCPQGSDCIVDSYRAVCVPRPPEAASPPSPPPNPDNNGHPTGTGIPQAPIAGVEPLCQNMACAQEEVCRVKETCDSEDSNTCTFQAVCLSSNDSRYLSGGCWTGEPLLVAQDGGGYDLRSCWTENNCRDGFYCSAELQDVSSRCCRAAPVSAPKNGTCPQPYNSTDRFFCTDECRSDADCHHDYKCCRQSMGCERNGCTPPDPCSLKTCPQDSDCVVDPNHRAHCIPRPPEPVRPPSPPLNPDDNNNGGNTAGTGIPQAPIARIEPLCQNMACAQQEVCRVMETCDPPNSNACTPQAVCLSSNDSRYLSGGCRTGEPLLVAQDGGGYDLRACWTGNNCRDGFYCSAELQDVSSRCCRAAPESTPKVGKCPKPDNSTDRFFCADECRSDADCYYHYKCCRKSVDCDRNRCTPPDPCSLKTCEPGFDCVVSPDFRAHCVPRRPEPPSPPPSPANNNNGNNNHQHPTEGHQSVCPHPLSTLRRGECTPRNMCSDSWGPWRCPVGKFCCRSAFCGDICRRPRNLRRNRRFRKLRS